MRLLSYPPSWCPDFSLILEMLFITTYTHHLTLMWCHANIKSICHTFWAKYKLLDDIELVLELINFFAETVTIFQILQYFNTILFSFFLLSFYFRTLWIRFLVLGSYWSFCMNLNLFPRLFFWLGPEIISTVLSIYQSLLFTTLFPPG